MTKEEHKHLRKTAAEYDMTIKEVLLAGAEELSMRLSARSKKAIPQVKYRHVLR